MPAGVYNNRLSNYDLQAEHMRLSDLLKFKNIVIQCHDNPDADALASGYAIMWFFEQNHKKARFIYRGRNEIQKSNLQMMLKKLKVPVEYQPFVAEEPDLIITVDCQYGQKNVTASKAKQIAVIDHHQKVNEDYDPNYTCIRNDVGSCSTICWDLLKEEGLNPNDNKLLATALYYGLFSDTNRLSEVSHPLDRDMLDSLVINKGIINEMINSNISLEELKITGRAMINYEYHESNKYLLIEAEPCDPCILGIISDFALETENVDVCVAFFANHYEVKYSVRSCSKEIHADELAAYIAEDLGGGGGGHMLKAGGTISPDYLTKSPKETIAERLAMYYDRYLVIYAKKFKLNTSKMLPYEKIPQSMGCVKLSDIFPVGSSINIRTVEGDIDTVVANDSYLIIDVEGEIFPIKENKLLNTYQLTNFMFTRDFEYEPRIKNMVTGEVKLVLPYAKSVRSIVSEFIYAMPIEQPVKLFTAWSDDKYYSGQIGDYLGVRADDEHDIFIIKGDSLGKYYKPKRN